VRQLIVESALVAGAGGAIGVVSAQILLRILVTLAPTQLPRLDEVRVHGSLLGSVIGVTTTAVLFFGVLPALAAARVDVTTLQLGARSGTRTRGHHIRRQWLVASQMALAVVMLAGSGLLTRSLLRLEHLSLGYQTKHLSIGTIAIGARYDTFDKIMSLSEHVMQRIQAIPGVTAATPILVPPFVGPNAWRAPFEPEGQIAADSGAGRWFPMEAAGTEYFRTFGTPIVRGREFRDSDREDAPPVVVVSESIARQFWPGEDPLGKRMRVARAGVARGSTLAATAYAWLTVVGIVPDTRFRALRDTWPMVYLPSRGGWQGSFAVQSIGTVEVADALRAALREMDPTLVVRELRSMDEIVGAQLAEPRFVALLATTFGAVALMLAAIGLYGAIDSGVRERTREIGIRAALGATPAKIREAVLRQTLMLTTTGALVGLMVALMATRLLRSLLFEVSPTDPVTLGLVCVVLVAVSLLAASFPARRATRIDPVRALRAE
jgi:predicted permease